MTSTELVKPRDEPRALTNLTFDELTRAAGGIGSMHRAIADRAFGLSGPQATPARVLHDAISSTVYAGLRGGFRAVGLGADVALRRRRTRSELSTSPGGAFLLAVVNGLIGDVLHRDGSDLAEPMSVRAGGRPVVPDGRSLRAAFPDAKPRVVVFLHGLMETEFAWCIGEDEPYGERLSGDLEVTPVFVRYNTGRHISENGRCLADLLETVVAEWPVDVSEVALVGHSMGGLVARSACHQAKGDAMDWVQCVRHVVSLGSPHLGAPLEQLVHRASAMLHRLPETRPFGHVLRRRSSGIRDLNQGSLVDEDWRGRDPDALELAACNEVPLLDGAAHCFVSATVTRSPQHPVGRLLGDTLVLHASATGRSRKRSIGFDEEYGLHVGGAHHIALLNHPAVYQQMRDWLAR